MNDGIDLQRFDWLFEGDREDLGSYLERIKGHFYVYVLCRPEGMPFYIGKGLNRRVLEHELEARQAHPVGESNPFKCNVIRKILRSGQTVLYRIDSIYPKTEETACLQREAELIVKFGRYHEGGPLTNLAGGVGNASGAAPFSLEKHAATLSGAPENNPQRAILNTFLQGIGPVSSVPVKPIDQISRLLSTKPHTQPRQPTKRCAYAFIASASAHGLQIQSGVHIPRKFRYRDVTGVIENGVARDILKAGMANLVPSEKPEEEMFALDKKQCGIIADLVGEDELIERGLL